MGAGLAAVESVLFFLASRYFSPIRVNSEDFSFSRRASFWPKFACPCFCMSQGFVFRADCLPDIPDSSFNNAKIIVPFVQDGMQLRKPVCVGRIDDL